MDIIRIVRLSFRSEKVDDFLQIYENSKNKIRSFKGCTHLELMRDTTYYNVFYTYSKWDSAEALELYRQSAIFKDTWAKTKLLFDNKPAAFSLSPFITE